MQFYSIAVVIGLSIYFWIQINKAQRDGVIFPGLDNGRFVRELRRQSNPAEFDRRVLGCKMFIVCFLVVGIVIALL